ncbi:unnamed protein product [Meganyctiphanes norvegica]|uniref:Uncharacterized protein n=1 Tax=Meganyctiphanes norvegica TaxID=48144 RepID=A0AAV2PMV1_MEGNR
MSTRRMSSYVILLLIIVLTSQTTRESQGPALLEAAKSGDISTTEAIIASGGDVNYTDPATGFSALHWGVRKSQKRIVEILLKAGAVVDIRDNKEQTPLLFAVLMNNLELAEIFVDAGANVNVKDWHERSGLHYCAINNRVSLAHLLLDNGADIDLQDTNLETPLHITARKDDPSVAQLLRVRGADVTIINIDKRTAYEEAVEKGKMNVATFINGCVVDDMVHEDGSTWQSPDHCIMYYCHATLITSEEGLCCVVDDMVHEDGSTWQSPDHCIMYYCHATLITSEEGLCTSVTQPSSNASTELTPPWNSSVLIPVVAGVTGGASCWSLHHHCVSLGEENVKEQE